MIPPRGGALGASAPWGILAFSRNREIRNSSDSLVWIFCFMKLVQNQNPEKSKIDYPSGSVVGRSAGRSVGRLSGPVKFPNRKPEKPEKPKIIETGETETAVLNRFPKSFKVPDLGQIKSYRSFRTTTRTGILRSFF